ncbi:MAG: molybdenum cofactor guanylyltransferase MobA, partial [Thiohalomonadales bacterium]
IHGIILAGGKASRMQGVDKGLQLLNGKPLIEHVFERLRPQVHSMTISANRNISDYEKFLSSVIVDEGNIDCGPLLGILSAMKHIKKTASSGDWVVLTPCDAPRVADNLVQKLTRDTNIPLTKISALLPFDGQRHQALFSMLPLQVIDRLQDTITIKNLKVTDWLLSLSPHIVDLSDIAATFSNINTLQQLHSLQSRP